MVRLIPLLLLLLAGANLSVGQPANQILDQMAETYLARIAAVSDYTVVAEGFRSYHKKYVNPAGSPYFKTVTEGPLGMGRIGNMTTTLHTDDLVEFRDRAFDRAENSGRVMLRGANAHRLRITDFSAFDVGDGQTPDSVRFYVHPESWVLMRIEIHGSDAGNGSMTPTIDFEDYREVEGMRYPFITRVTMVGAQVDVSPEDVERARDAIEQLEDRLAAMPASQRDALMAMMQPQIERMQKIVDSGTLETVFAVTELRVNSGLDDAMFN